MANEIAFSGSLTVSPSIGRARSALVSGFRASMAGSRVIDDTQLIGTSEEAIDLGEITSVGWAYFKNLDVTNYLEIYNGSAGAKLVKLLAGESAFFRMPPTCVPYALANTAACYLEYIIAEL